MCLSGPFLLSAVWKETMRPIGHMRIYLSSAPSRTSGTYGTNYQQSLTLMYWLVAPTDGKHPLTGFTVTVPEPKVKIISRHVMSRERNGTQADLWTVQNKPVPRKDNYIYSVSVSLAYFTGYTSNFSHWSMGWPLTAGHQRFFGAHEITKTSGSDFTKIMSRKLSSDNSIIGFLL